MKINRILLLDPPFFRFLNEDQRGVPLGPAFLAGSLMAEGYDDVIIYNADFDPHERLGVSNRAYADEMAGFDAYRTAVTNDNHAIYREVISTIEAYKPDLIGISLRIAKFFITKTIIRLCREVLGDVPIVIGGPHASAMPDHVLNRSAADFVVRGEGERTFIELIAALNRDGDGLGSVTGLSYRENGEVRHNSPRALIMDLDTLPFPARDIILHSHRMVPDDYGNIFSSRGCPFNCSFCDSRGTWTRKARRHSPKYIVDQIVSIKEKFGASFFCFEDDIFVAKESDAIAVCDEMQRRGLADLPKTEFRWWCEIHPRLVTQKMVTRMKEVNCVSMAIGAESGSQRTLSQVDKSSSLDHIRKAADIIRDADLSLTIFFMIGFPGETEADMEETLALMEELEPDNPTVSIVTPLPGTPIYEQCEKQGLLRSNDPDFLTLFHQRSSYFYSDEISEERSRIIIADALTRCENLSKRKKRDRINRFFRDRISPEILATEGVRVRVVDDVQVLDSGAASENSSPPHLNVAIDQSYTQEKIFVHLQKQDRVHALSEGCIKKVETDLLTEFPQYLAVEVVNQPGGNGEKDTGAEVVTDGRPFVRGDAPGRSRE